MNNLYMKDLETMCDSLDKEKQNEIISFELTTFKNDHVLYL